MTNPLTGCSWRWLLQPMVRHESRKLPPEVQPEGEVQIFAHPMPSRHAFASVGWMHANRSACVLLWSSPHLISPSLPACLPLDDGRRACLGMRARALEHRSATFDERADSRGRHDDAARGPHDRARWSRRNVHLHRSEWGHALLDRTPVRHLGRGDHFPQPHR